MVGFSSFAQSGRQRKVGLGVVTGLVLLLLIASSLASGLLANSADAFSGQQRTTAHSTGASIPSESNLTSGYGIAASANSPSPTGPASSPIRLAPGFDFPTYLGDVERTSSASSEQLINLSTASSLHLLWNYTSAGREIQSQPVEQNGIVYFGSLSGYEYAVYGTNGTFLWKTFLGQDQNDTACGGPTGVTSTATVVGNVLYVDGGFPYLYALNSSSGAVEWRVLIGGSDSLGFYDWSSPLIYDDYAYIGIASDCDQPLVPAGLAQYLSGQPYARGLLQLERPRHEWFQYLGFRFC